jgi:hypothetical protein
MLNVLNGVRLETGGQSNNVSPYFHKMLINLTFFYTLETIGVREVFLQGGLKLFALKILYIALICKSRLQMYNSNTTGLMLVEGSNISFSIKQDEIYCNYIIIMPSVARQGKNFPKTL